MTTLVGDSTCADQWMRGLRDGDTGLWSRPVASQQLDDAYAAAPAWLTRLAHPPGSPERARHDASARIKRVASIKGQAVETEGDLKAVELCQKPSALRTQEDIKFIQSYMCSLSYFFSLWPAPLQWELCRLLSAHILARREVALTRGKPPDRLYFVVQGRLDVRLPVPSPGGGREERTLAVLTRGNTAGESILLGAQTQHTTVVVSSSSAMLLSLSQPDFSRAFKEVLDIRQAERLTFLRMHPLLAEVPLTDLEAASEVLGLAFHPPGTRLWPLDEPDRCLYFLAEGEAKVKRTGGPAAAAAATTLTAAAASGDPDAVTLGPSTYDSHTVSVLGPGDIFGLPSSDQALALQLQQACGAATAALTSHGQLLTANSAGLPHEHSQAAGAAGAHLLGPSASVATIGSVVGGERSQIYGSTVGSGGVGAAAGAATANVVIESFTQVKVYFVKYADYPRLPAVVQRLLQAANSFRWSYYEGRMYGLSKMDNRRRNAQRNAAIRKHNNAALQRRGGGTGGAGDPLSKPALVAALDAAERDRQLLARLPILCMGMAQAAGAGHHAADAGRPAHGPQPVARNGPEQHQRWQVQRSHDEHGGDRATGGRRNSSGLPLWAFPQPGGEASGETGLQSSAGAAAATAAAATPGAGRTGTDRSGRGNVPAQGLTQQGTISGSSIAAGGSSLSMERRPGSADTVSTRCPTASVLGTGTAAGRRGSRGAGHGSGAGSMGGALNPLLQRNKALLAVQAQQLAHVLASERQQYGQRFAVLHPELRAGGRECAAEGEGDSEGWWDGEEEAEEGEEYEGSVDYGDGSGSHLELREGARGRLQGYTRGLHSRGGGGQGGDVSYRRSLSPPKATLGLLPPGQSAFPRVEANTGKRHSVQTEQPRSLSAPQSIHARHLALFQRARAQAQADGAARPWDRAARAQRPTFGRPTDSNGYPINDGGSPTFAGGVLPLPGSRFGSPSSYDPATGLLLPVQRTPSGRPQRPDDRLSRYGSTGRTSSAGGVRPGGSGTNSSNDGTAGAGGCADAAPGGLHSPKLARAGAAAGQVASPGRGVGTGGVWRGSVLVPMSPELSFSNLGVKDVEEEDDSSEEGELDLLYSNMDDDTLLARVPARLLGKGAAAGTPGAEGQAGAGAAGKAAAGGSEARGSSRVVELPLGFDPMALPAPSAGFRQPAAVAAPAPAATSGSGAGTAGSGGAGVTALGSGVRQPAPAPSAPAASIGAGGGVAGSGRSGGTLPQGASSGPAEVDGGGPVGSGPAAFAGGGLNFTMRRKGAAGPGAAPGLGSGVGPGAGLGGSASSPRVALGGSGAGGSGTSGGAGGLGGGAAGSGSTVGGGTGVGRPGAVGSGGAAAGTARSGSTVATGVKGSGSVARMLDALYPQDLDQSLTQHHHHQSGGGGAGNGPNLGATSISPSPPAGGRNAPGTPPPSALHPSPTHAASSSSQPVTPLQQQQQQQQQPQAPVGQAPAAPQGLGLPPGIALGYESLDPFQWAALSAQVGPGMIKTPFTQDNILPKPQW